VDALVARAKALCQTVSSEHSLLEPDRTTDLRDGDIALKLLSKHDAQETGGSSEKEDLFARLVSFVCHSRA
jgi:hypothetical protein